MKKRLIGTFVAAAVLAPALTLAGTGQAFAAGNRVTWRNNYNGKYLTYLNNRVRTINADPSQSPPLWWDEFKQSDGAYVMQHHMTGKCLDSNSNGDVYLLNCNGGDYQRWYESHDSSGWRLKNKATGRVLEALTTGEIRTAADEGYPVQRWS
ncbi:RICIN domain-containing protein [Streptomyces sp. NPDC052107]|jgi:Ricin-type beta-trefoil lectin domain-like|uniref:RICIN domain-containing protein n=1 Tax=Streptomyces sp. NPDC052107 TaxID=3155632 RepID=UPI003418B2B6